MSSATSTPPIREPVRLADPDHDSVARVLAGDTSAFGGIVRRHERTLRRVVTGIVADRDAAEDVLQETLLIAYRRLPTWRAEAPLERWMVSIAVREALRTRSRLRRWSLRRVPLEEPTSTVRHEGSHRVVQVEEALALLEKLPRRERAALVLHFVEDRPYREIAEILGCPIGTVGSLVSRARARLRGRGRLGGARDPERSDPPSRVPPVAGPLEVLPGEGL